MTQGIAAKPTALFKKTAMCKFHAEGKCLRGESCSFAHGLEDVRAAPDLRCTRMCRAFKKLGVCTDPSCRFAHSKKELRALPNAKLTHTTAQRKGGTPSGTSEEPTMMDVVKCQLEARLNQQLQQWMKMGGVLRPPPGLEAECPLVSMFLLGKVEDPAADPATCGGVETTSEPDDTSTSASDSTMQGYIQL
eukprot:TRINITY_DN6815_c0_g1_i2.p1 TRINITY_DN6815_c0_g1~~TRINITY_DN6815_c0_g1_i2.p1  ORF type:complete len:191 (-),score=44.44 TRINITY_DN6815_c0_g1_i2:205-777(-)